MKLTIFERLMLVNLLPHEGDFITLKLLRKLRETLSFSEKEIEGVEFKTHWKCPKCEAIDIAQHMPKCDKCGVYMVNNGQVTWDDTKATAFNKEIHMGTSMHILCQTLLKKLSSEKKLTADHMSLYEKFVEDTAEEAGE